MPLYFPLASWHLTKCDAKVLDPVYERRYGALHPGSDINGAIVLPGNREGSDRDWRWMVISMGPGVVTASEFRPIVGHIVQIAVKMPDGRTFWQTDWHLEKRLVRVGDRVNPGTVIGAIGKAENNAQPSHLHHEIRRVGPAVLRPDHWSSAYWKARYPGNPAAARAAALREIQTHYVVDHDHFYRWFKFENLVVPVSRLKV